MEVEPAIVDDAGRLAAVYRSAYRENRELGFPTKAESVTASTVAEWIDHRRVLVARVDDEVVGGVRLEETDRGRLKLGRLGVHDDWKGNGIGSRLVDEAEALARGEGYETMWLTAPPEHPFLPGFYRGRGYDQTGEYPLSYRDYDEVVLEKRL